MHRRWTSGLVLALAACASWAGCGDDGGEPPAADAGPRDTGTDAGPPVDCADDADCDDGSFCNGPERCVRDDSGDRACVRGSAPCAPAGQTCDETMDACTSECPDEDGDGHTDAACGGDDCDDRDPERFGGNPELCDEIDQDCDPETLGPDGDGDGHVAIACCNTVERDRTCGQDCDDDDAMRAPGLDEVCNGIDDDCDGALAPGEDDDGDEHVSTACGGDDCDDSAANVFAGAPELCNGVDDDCDDARPPWDDPDGDGYASDVAECRDGVLPTTDCDDDASSVHPAAPEVCDGIDSDCDGVVPVGDDDDDDGYAAVDSACIAGTLPKSDCDDANPDVHPGTAAACVIGEDRDCDGAPGSLRGGADSAITSVMRDRSQASAVAVGANVLVAWVDLRDGAAPAIYAKLVTPDGSAVTGSVDARLSTGTATASRPAALATDDGGALVVWSQGRTVLARTVSATGAFGATTHTLVDSPDGLVASAASRVGAAMVVAWEDSSSTVPGQRVVWARSFALDGVAIAAAQQLSAAMRSAIDPRVAVAGDRVWVGWVQSGPESGDRAAIWARPVGADAVPSAAAVQVSGSSGRATGVAIGAASDGSAVFVWSDDRDGAPDTELYARSRSSAGVLGTERRLTTGAGASRGPTLLPAASGGYTLVWEDARDAMMGDTELYTTELDASAMRRADLQRVTNAGGLSQGAWLADIGGGAWIAFRDTRSGSAHIYVRALSCED